VITKPPRSPSAISYAKALFNPPEDVEHTHDDLDMSAHGYHHSHEDNSPITEIPKSSSDTLDENFASLPLPPPQMVTQPLSVSPAPSSSHLPFSSFSDDTGTASDSDEETINRSTSGPSTPERRGKPSGSK